GYRQIDVDEGRHTRAPLGAVGLVEAAHRHGIVRKSGGGGGRRGVFAAEGDGHAVDYGWGAWVSSAPPRRKQSRVNECRPNRRKSWKQIAKPSPATATVSPSATPASSSPSARKASSNARIATAASC